MWNRMKKITWKQLVSGIVGTLTIALGISGYLMICGCKAPDEPRTTTRPTFGSIDPDLEGLKRLRSTQFSNDCGEENLSEISSISDLPMYTPREEYSAFRSLTAPVLFHASAAASGSDGPELSFFRCADASCGDGRTMGLHEFELDGNVWRRESARRRDEGNAAYCEFVASQIVTEADGEARIEYRVFKTSVRDDWGFCDDLVKVREDAVPRGCTAQFNLNFESVQAAPAPSA